MVSEDQVDVLNNVIRYSISHENCYISSFLQLLFFRCCIYITYIMTTTVTLQYSSMYLNAFSSIFYSTSISFFSLVLILWNRSIYNSLKQQHKHRNYLNISSATPPNEQQPLNFITLFFYILFLCWGSSESSYIMWWSCVYIFQARIMSSAI